MLGRESTNERSLLENRQMVEIFLKTEKFEVCRKIDCWQNLLENRQMIEIFQKIDK